eukprot:SAG31_NODE_15662_length_744_cov_0.879070_1_plen_33_part_10
MQLQPRAQAPIQRAGLPMRQSACPQGDGLGAEA